MSSCGKAYIGQTGQTPKKDTRITRDGFGFFFFFALFVLPDFTALRRSTKSASVSSLGPCKVPVIFDQF